MKWQQIFPDPDEVGQSEYRAIHDCVGDALCMSNPCDQVDGDATIAEDDVSHLIGILREFHDWSNNLLTDITQTRGLRPNDRVISIENPSAGIYIVDEVVGESIRLSLEGDRDNKYSVSPGQLKDFRIVSIG